MIASIQDRSRLKQRLTKYLEEGKGQTSSLCDSILIHLEQHNDQNLIKLIIEDFTIALRSLTSQTVLQASRLLDLLARSQNQQLTMAFNNKEFQESMMFALRGKSTGIMNKLTLHPMAWQEIEQTLLALYQWWFFQLGTDEPKYHLIIQNYKQLRVLGIQFPPMDEDQPKQTIVKQATVKSSETPKIVKQPSQPSRISEQDMEQLEKLALTSQMQLKKQQWDTLLTTDNVRLIKSKVTLLYETFSKGNLEPNAKQLVKQLYSRLRAVLKQLDRQNDMIKLQKEKEYMEQKKGISSIKTLPKESPTKTESPPKSVQMDDLLGGEKQKEEMPKVPLPAAQNIKSFEDIFGAKEDDGFSQFQSSQTQIPSKELLDIDINSQIESKQLKQTKLTKETKQAADAPLIDIEPAKQPPKSPQKPEPLKAIPVDFTL